MSTAEARGSDRISAKSAGCGIRPTSSASILEPDFLIVPSNRFLRLVTRDGATITGRMLNQDAFTVQLIDSKEQLRSLNRADLKELTFIDKSPMPSYRGKLSAQEITDLVSYLVSLQGGGQ